MPNGPPVAVLGYPLWQARYGGDPDVVGRTVMLNDVPVAGDRRDARGLPAADRLQRRSGASRRSCGGRCRCDMTATQSATTASTRARRSRPGRRAASATEELRAITHAAHRAGRLSASRCSSRRSPCRLDDEIRGGMRPAMWLLMGAVGFLLLIACVNVANLLLVRGDARLREMAVRTAIGAAPNRLVRQLFTESVVLAVARRAPRARARRRSALRVLMTIDPTSLPPLAPVRLDCDRGRLHAGARRGHDARCSAWRRRCGRCTSTWSSRCAKAASRRRSAAVGSGCAALLVVAEVALAVVLVIGAGLMIRSLSALGRIDLGFNPDQRADDARVGAGGALRHAGEGRGLLSAADEARARAARCASRRASCACCRWRRRSATSASTSRASRNRPGVNAKGDWQIVSDGAFEAMGARLMRGRWFTADRHASSRSRSR